LCRLRDNASRKQKTHTQKTHTTKTHTQKQQHKKGSQKYFKIDQVSPRKRKKENKKKQKTERDERRKKPPNLLQSQAKTIFSPLFSFLIFFDFLVFFFSFSLLLSLRREEKQKKTKEEEKRGSFARYPLSKFSIFFLPMTNHSTTPQYKSHKTTSWDNKDIAFFSSPDDMAGHPSTMKKKKHYPCPD